MSRLVRCAVVSVGLCVALLSSRVFDFGHQDTMSRLLSPQAASAQGDSDASSKESAEDARDRRIMERFLLLLKRQPRFGTALDRVYGHHIERGTIDDFVQSLKDAVTENAEDGTTWLILGLIEMQRGRDIEAVEALQQAETHRPDDPLASYYLGRTLVLVGKPSQAAEAFERAIERKPLRADLLEIYQALGRAHQRAQRTEEALAVWDRLEQQFPDDLRVQEQIATILEDEEDYAGALKRYQSLQSKSKDAYRKVQYGIKAAELKIQTGKKDDAIADFEGLLADLKPDSWLHRDVRQRIEAVFLRADDYAGLSTYYERWLKTHQDDIDAMSRLGRTLSLQGRLPEAKPWYDKAVKLAPSNRSLRKSYIDQLIQGKQFAAAVEQYEQLDKLDPGNPDNIREWGQLILEDKNTPEADRKKLASDVWRRLLEARPEDAVIASQVADLFRHAKMTEPAIELYRKAIELAPNDPQYREYLGEYYHSLERKDDAVETWQVIAAGKNRNTRNLIRLAEVYHGFGYREQAVEAMGEAMKLDPEFADRVRYGQMLRDTEQYDESLAEFDTADSLTEDSEERQLVLNERIKTLQLADRMAATIEELEAELGDKPTIEQWQTLARYYQADRRIASAAESVKQALAIDEDDVQSWKVAAEIYESGGMIADAVAANRKLTTLDRRYRTEHLTKIATLEMRLGRVDEALEAGRELLAAAPGNPEHYRFFADLNFQSGRSDEGLDALRRAVRVNPADTSVLIALASALADQFRTSEAIELYWRAFDKAEDLDGQISVVNTMTELYLRTNHFDRLVDKLERLGRELDAERDMALCLAAAHRASGDFGTARETLEELLDEETRDTQLLAQLVQLAEAENDYELAARYQRQINELAPSRDNKQALAGLLVRTGDAEEAEKLWMELSEGEREPHRIIDGIDSMITNDKFDAALQLVDKRLRDNPRDWEAHLRAAIAHWKADRKDEAAKSLHALLDINLPPDTLSAKAEHLKSQAKKTSAGQSGHGHSHASARSAAMQNYPRVLMRSQAIYQVTRLLQLNPNYGNSQAAWSPNDFGEARIAALAVLHNYATTKGNADEFLKELEEKADPDATRISSATWDWYFLNQMVQQQTQNYAKSYELAKRMSYSRDPAAMLMYLSTLRMRNYKPGVNYRTQADFLKGATPLSDEELKHVKECYAAINAQYPSWSGMSGGVMVLVNELKLAKREEEADKLYAETLENASDPQAISILMQMAGSLGKMDDMMMLVRKLRSLPQSRSVSGQSFVTNSYYQWGQMMAQLSGKEEFDKVRELLDVTLEDLAEKFAATPSHRRGASSTQSRSRVYAQVYQANGSSRGQQLDYPQPNAFFDNGGIILLYNAWHQHQEAELSDEFLGYLDAKAANADQKLAPIARLALAYVSWWSDDKSESMRQLQFAQKAAPDVLELRLELAGLYQQQGQQQEALRLLEEIEPSNHNILRSRELLALNVSVSVGDIERARKAAERLFGLQLDTNLQLQLAQQMHQLGMHEMAEGVLARLRRRSGGQTSTLVQLMNQYRNQGKKDIATQIANQILRRTKPNPSSSRRTSEDSYRQQAVQVLAASGQLDEIIGRVKAQLKKSPKSVRLHEILADYYRAAGKNDEARAIVEKITDLRPDDAKHLYSLAQQLYRSRDYKASCDTYLKAIRIDPSVMGNDFYNVQNAFRREKRMEELGRVMLDIDLKSFSQRYYYMSQFYSQLMRDEATRQLGIDLFKKSWEAFPQYRHYLIGQIYNDEVWQLDE
ncbi:MAG: tetratricopeptide repeat protein, partial [Planctomycetota bacterium]